MVLRNKFMCEFSRCDRLVSRGKLCEAHRKQKQRCGKMWPINSHIQYNKICKFNDCERAASSLGLCHNHYIMARGYSFTDNETDQCSESNCKGLHYAKSYCKPHYDFYRQIYKRVSTFGQKVNSLLEYKPYKK